MEFFIIYLFVMVEKLSALFGKGYAFMTFALVIMFITTVIVLIQTSCDDDPSFKDKIQEQPYKPIIRFTKWVACIGLLFGLLGSLMPDQKQLAIIVGSGVTYNVLTSEPAKRIGGKALQLIEQQVDNALKDEIVPEKVIEKGKKAIIEKVEGAAL